MRIVLVTETGSVGNRGVPAGHADLLRALEERGHDVTLLTGGARCPTDRPVGAALVRGAGLGMWLMRHAREYDVVYAAAMPATVVAAARLAGRPVVVEAPHDFETPPGAERPRRAAPPALGRPTTSQTAEQILDRVGRAAARATWWVRRATVRAADQLAPTSPPPRAATAAGDIGSSLRPVEDVERLLVSAIRGRPRAVLLTRSLADPDGTLEGETEVLGRYLRATIIGSGGGMVRHPGTARTIALPAPASTVARAAIFHTVGPLVAVALSVGRRRSAVIGRSPHEAIGTIALTRLLPRSIRPLVVVEVLEERRTASRPTERSTWRFLAPVGDRLAGAALARADRVRAVDVRTEGRARELGWHGETDRFPRFSRYDLFLKSPPVEAPGGPRVLFVGALEPAKGIDVLLDAWEEVHRRRPDAILAIVGAGSLEDEVRERAGRLGPGAVRLVGAVDRAEVKTLMDRAAVVVAPSRAERPGRVVVEAFARGRPVVGTWVGGIPDVVLEGERGLVAPSEDPAALAAGVLRLLDDPDAATEMGRRARSTVERLDLTADYVAGIERLVRWIDDRDRAKGVRE